MELQFLIATLMNLFINLLYTIIALYIGLMALRFVDKKLLTTIDIEAEIKRGNMSVAVFSSTILLFVALIVAVGLKG